MSDRSIARQYAHALFDVAARSGETQAVGRYIAEMAVLVANHADLKSVIETPLVTPSQKRGLLDALIAAGGPINIEVQRMLELLADRDRLRLLGEVAAAYAARLMDAERVVSADVVSAVPLNEEGQAQLARALGKVTGRTVTIHVRVDPSIVGGVIARVGSLVFDGSVTRQIERMRERLHAEA